MKPKSLQELWLLVLAPLALGIIFTFVSYRTIRPQSNTLPSITIGNNRSSESCLLCHSNVQGIGEAHSDIGCSPCHLGNPSASTEKAAHTGLELLSGDLSTVGQTCGKADCHAIETSRVSASLMARAPGILAVDRYAFGERNTPDRNSTDDISSLDKNSEPKSPAESHARKLCLGCHLGSRKPKPGDLGAEARGGGCTACHLAPPNTQQKPSSTNNADNTSNARNTDNSDNSDNNPIGPPSHNNPQAQSTTASLHPEISAIVPERRCIGCHGRSGRITMSFRGIVELEPNDQRVTGSSEDGRPIGKSNADVHAKIGMTCVDCHSERDLMGSGTRNYFAHEEVEIDCETCHQPVLSRTESDPDRERVAQVLRRSWLRHKKKELSATPLRTRQSTPLVRTDAPSHSLQLVTTADTRVIPLSSTKPWHTLNGHERLSCQSCHANWAPRCRSCHTSFEKDGSDVDHLSNQLTPGHWTEVAGQNGFGLPLLAVGQNGKISTFVEGMKMTLNVGDSLIEKTLYAPLDPHTTGKARSCESCHQSIDDTYPQTGEITRPLARILNSEELRKITLVGKCITCHKTYEDKVFLNFQQSLKTMRPQCLR